MWRAIKTRGISLQRGLKLNTLADCRLIIRFSHQSKKLIASALAGDTASRDRISSERLTFPPRFINCQVKRDLLAGVIQMTATRIIRNKIELSDNGISEDRDKTDGAKKLLVVERIHCPGATP